MADRFYNKYIVQHSDGTPVNPLAHYFILRLDHLANDKEWISLCRKTLRFFCNNLPDEHKRLKEDLTSYLNNLNTYMPLQKDTEGEVSVELSWTKLAQPGQQFYQGE